MPVFSGNMNPESCGPPGLLVFAHENIEHVNNPNAKQFILKAMAFISSLPNYVSRDYSVLFSVTFVYGSNGLPGGAKSKASVIEFAESI